MVSADHDGWGGNNILGTFSTPEKIVGFTSKAKLDEAVIAALTAPNWCPGGGYAKVAEYITGSSGVLGDDPDASRSKDKQDYWTVELKYTGGGTPKDPNACRDAVSTYLHIYCNPNFRYWTGYFKSIECVEGQSRPPHPADADGKETGDCGEKPCPPPFL